MSEHQTLRIIVLREEELFVAQCLELDICTSAGSFEELQDVMNDLIELELSHTEETGQAIDPAPERFHNMWDQAIQQANGEFEYRLAA